MKDQYDASGLAIKLLRNSPQIMRVHKDILSEDVWIAGVVEETADVAFLLCVHDVTVLIITKHGPH